MGDWLIGLGIAVGLRVASSIDLISGFLRIIGPLDDIVVVALALCYAGRHVARDVLLAAWLDEPRLIERVLGPTTTNPATLTSGEQPQILHR